MIVRDRAYMNRDGTPPEPLIRGVIDEHGKRLARLERLRAYYDMKHEIAGRIRSEGLPNTKMVHDLPRYIVTMASGYLIGKPVTYSTGENEAALETITEAYDAANTESVDAELAADASTYGRAVEVLYADEDSAPRCAQIDPRSAFVVYDDTVEHKPMFGVQIIAQTDMSGAQTGKKYVVLTESARIVYTAPTNGVLSETSVEAVEEHYFGGVPMVEYWNNADEHGDYENVIPLIDAYDMLQSDRINDKMQFVDALLVLIGVSNIDRGYADFDEYEKPGEEPGSRPACAPSLGEMLRRDKTISLPKESDAKWLYKQLSEADVEVLRKAIISDIHKLSMVPDLTDENFASNSSGVAMRYKLLGLEQLTKIKERWFKEGLRTRLRLFSDFLRVKAKKVIDPDEVTITFTRSLPVNELEVAQMVQTLDGIVPTEILLGQVPFVSDVKAALEMIASEKAEAEAERARMFETSYQISPPGAREDEDARKDAVSGKANGSGKAHGSGKSSAGAKGSAS